MQTPDQPICGDTYEHKGSIHACGREQGHSKGKIAQLHMCHCGCGLTWIGKRKLEHHAGDTLKK